MNGAVYISFFQGQLETVLEQVVQLAVQEISKTVGSSLNALLLETAVKEQENRRLRLQLQSSAEETRGRGNDSSSADGGTSAAAAAAAAAGKKKAGKVSGDERPNSGRTKSEQPQLHPPRGLSNEPGGLVDTRRLEQRGRVVDQLKAVMQQVLDFAVCELTKIVEASFDDLMLEITKMEKEHQVLEERLGNGCATRGGAGGVGGRRRGSENNSMSLNGSEDAKEDLGDVTVSKEKAVTSDPARPPVLSVSQDWVPILDKVFGQQWCSDVWQIKDVGGGGGGGRGLSEAGVQQMQQHPIVSVALDPSSPQHDPRWTPLEDMEVLSPDDDPDQRNPGDGANTAIGRPSLAPPLSPSRSSSRHSSASMLQRLLTLPSQLLEDNDAAAAASKETLATLAADDTSEPGECLEQTCPPPPTVKEEEEDEEEVEEEEGDEEGEKGRKKKRRRMWSECDECGRRFSRVLLLKAHRQTHAATDATSPSSPPSSTSSLRCSECGKRFSSVTRLHSHTRTQHPGIQS